MGERNRDEDIYTSSEDGTAARTRAISFNEILSHRAKKAATGLERVHADLRGTDEDFGNTGGPADIVVGTSTSTKELDDVPTRKSKENAKFERDDESLMVKPKSKIRSEVSRVDMSSISLEGKDEKHSKIRRNSSVKKADSHKESVKKDHNRELDTDRVRMWELNKDAKRKFHRQDENGRLMFDRHAHRQNDQGNSEAHERSERNGRRAEHYELRYEERKSKRRHPDSHDYNRERHDRPTSEAVKHRNYSFDHEDPGDYDKSRKKYREDDRRRTSVNGSYGAGGSYHKKSSGLGGYSPRKRKVEKEVIVPSPTNRSPEKKTAKWDQAPASLNHHNVESVVNVLQSTVNKMSTSLSVVPVSSSLDPSSLLGTILTAKNASADAVQLTQATRPMRRLYIENLPSSASEKMLVDCLNDFFLSSGGNDIQGTKTCLSCTINKEKCQALVEFLTPEDATIALSFDGRTLLGSVLKIRRPKDYVETIAVAEEKPAKEAKVISDEVEDSLHKIFVAGISDSISSDMLLDIVGVFGPVAAYRFMYNEELDGPCAFIEYANKLITQKACAGLNGMKLGGRTIIAVQTFTAPKEGTTESPPFYGVPAHAKSLLADPTNVLLLTNAFDPEECALHSKSELDNLLEDIRLECSRYGTVKSMKFVAYSSTGDGNGDASAEPNIGLAESELVEGADELQDAAADDHPSNESNDSEHVCQDPASQISHEDSQNDLEEPDTPEQHVDQSKDTQGNDEPLMDNGEEDRPTGEAYLTEHKDCIEGDGSSHLAVRSSTPEASSADRADENKEDSTDAKPAEVSLHASVAGRNGSSCAEELFKPGSVLVEFMRKEAARTAAHALHGRLFGDRAVTTGYAPHDLYAARFQNAQ